MKNLKKYAALVSILLLAAGTLVAQTKPVYSFAAQRMFIPSDLGKVNLGISIKAFAKEIDITKGEIDDRFEGLAIEIPFTKGNISSLTVSVAGLDEADRAALIFEENVTKRGDLGDYETTVKRIPRGQVFRAWVRLRHIHWI